MRVLMVTHDAEHGGANTSVRSLLRHRPSGVDVEWVFLRDGPVVGLAPVPARVVPVGRAREVWRVPRAVEALRREVRAMRADIVFAQITKAQLYAGPAARLAGARSVWWQRERYGQKPLMHQVAGRLPADLVICSAEHSAAEQRRRFPRREVALINPGIEVDGLGLPREHTEAVAVRIGIVGRLQRWKRVELALRAMPAVVRALPDARLVVMGDAAPGLDEDYPGELRAEAARLGVAEHVEFAGHVQGAAEASRRLDLLVHCARGEPFGLAPLEAMARGVPVIVPLEGGPAETVRHGVDGLHVEPTDREALAAAIISLGRDPRRRGQMGAAARRRVLERYTAAGTARRTWELLAEVVSARPRR